MLNIEPIRSDEFPRVVEVWEASVRATHHFLTEADIAMLKPRVPEFLGAVDLRGVRDAKGHVVAFLGVAGRGIEMLFVHPSYRGRGIGRLLTEHAIQNLGADVVDVNEQNEQAVGFYLRMGFEVMGRSDVDAMGLPFPLLHMRLARPASVSVDAFRAWLDAYGDAWRTGDVEAVAALFAPDAAYHETPFDPPMVGEDAIRKYWKEGASDAQKDVRFAYRDMSVVGNAGVARWQASFNRIPSGNHVELDGILVAEFGRDGKCTVFREWWHRRERGEAAD